MAGAVLYFGVFHSAPNPWLFLDKHALLLVCGGTVAAAFISLPLSKLGDLLSLIIYGVIFKKKKSDLLHAQELMEATKLHNLGQSLVSIRETAGHAFLREALYLLKLTYLNEEDLRAVLLKRSDYFKRIYSSDAKALNSLAKFPPAFGLLGASTGMISMMIQLSSGGQSQIGSSMAIALVATFWGIGVSNFILLPLADYASKTVQEDQSTRHMIIDGVVMMRQQVEPRIMAERLAAYLPPHQRPELLSLVSKSSETVVDENTNDNNVMPLRKYR